LASGFVGMSPCYDAARHWGVAASTLTEGGRQHTWSRQHCLAPWPPQPHQPGKTFDHTPRRWPPGGCGHSSCSGRGVAVEAFLVSTGIVALAEIGDKTQLLAFILAARWRRPVPILAGILVATIVNHALAGALGAWLTTWLDPVILRWIL